MIMPILLCPRFTVSKKHLHESRLLYWLHYAIQKAVERQRGPYSLSESMRLVPIKTLRAGLQVPAVTVESPEMSSLSSPS